MESMSNIPIKVVRIEKTSDPKLGRTLNDMAACGWLA